MNILLFFVVFLVLAVFYVLSTYNWFATAKTRIEASIQEIGNQLKRQADLIPNLDSVAKRYLKHESGIFDKLTEARKTILQAVKSGDAQKMINATQALAPITALFESTPQLRGADAPTTRLMEELRDTADKIMYSRRVLIDLSADFNVKRVTIPSSLIANMFSFEKQQGLVLPEGAKETATSVKTEDLETPKISSEV